MASVKVGPRRIEWDRDGDGKPVVFWATRLGIVDLADLEAMSVTTGPPASGFNAARFKLMAELAIRKVARWERVIGEDDQPAECNEANRADIFFGEPGATIAVIDGLSTGTGTFRKNVSGGGSDSSENTPAPTAEKSTGTGKDAATTDAGHGTDANGSPV